MTEHTKEALAAFDKFYDGVDPDVWEDIHLRDVYIAGYVAGSVVATEKLSAEITELKEQLEIHKQHAKLDYLQIKSLNSKIELLENKPKRHDPHDDEHLYGGNVC